MIFKLEIRNLCFVDILIDDEDWDKIKNYKWKVEYTSGNFRVVCVKRGLRKNKKGRTRSDIYKISRIVMNAKSGEIVDHINGNGLDNRKCNLRICTAAQNSANFINKKRINPYFGVHKRGSKHYVYLSYKSRVHNLGSFSIEKEAALFYDEMVLKLRGEYAILNFPENRDLYETLNSDRVIQSYNKLISYKEKA